MVILVKAMLLDGHYSKDRIDLKVFNKDNLVLLMGIRNGYNNLVQN